jgi:hypothetical protein
LKRSKSSHFPSPSWRLLWPQWPLVLLLLKMMMMAALLWRNKTWKKEVVSDGSSFNWRKFGTC